jgi:hypothetical protein
MNEKCNSIGKLASRMSKSVGVLFLLISFEASAELFYVSLIRGNVTKAGVPLKTGDTLEDNNSETLEFSTTEDFVVVVSRKKGRYMIRAKEVQRSENRLWVLVKENLVPCTQENSLTTRSLVNIFDIKEFLQDGRFAMLDSIIIPLDKSFWEDRHQNYFIVNYIFDDEKVEKRIRFTEPRRSTDTLHLTIDSDLFLVKGQKIRSSEAQNMVLYFFLYDFSQSLRISDLTIVQLYEAPTFDELKVAFSAIDEFFNHDNKLIKKELKAHIQQFYGKIDDRSITKLIGLLQDGLASK